MLTVEDFTTGDTAYMLTQSKGKRIVSVITEHKVVAVSRKYVTIDQNIKFENFDNEFLQEAAVSGAAKKLFKTRREVDHYIEKQKLTISLERIVFSIMKNYRLD